jgi:hypothetical protein
MAVASPELDRQPGFPADDLHSPVLVDSAATGVAEAQFSLSDTDAEAFADIAEHYDDTEAAGPQAEANAEVAPVAVSEPQAETAKPARRSFKPGDLAREAYTRYVLGKGEVKERTASQMRKAAVGRFALKVAGVVGASTAFTLAMKATSAYAQVKHGIETGHDDTAANFHLVSYPADGGGDGHTHVLGDADTVNKFAQEDLKEAAAAAHVDPSHVDDLTKDPNAVHYVVDGYHDDPDNKGVDFKHLKEGGSFDSSDGEVRAADLAKTLKYYEDTLHPDANMHVKIAGVDVDLHDYVSGHRTTEDWATTRDCLWNWYKQDLAVEGRLAGLNDDQIHHLLSDNKTMWEGINIYADANHISHDEYIIVDGKNYSAIEGREHAYHLIHNMPEVKEMDAHDRQFNAHVPPEDRTPLDSRYNGQPQPHVDDVDTGANDDDNHHGGDMPGGAWPVPNTETHPSASPSASPDVSPSPFDNTEQEKRTHENGMAVLWWTLGGAAVVGAAAAGIAIARRRRGQEVADESGEHHDDDADEDDTPPIDGEPVARVDEPAEEHHDDDEHDDADLDDEDDDHRYYDEDEVGPVDLPGEHERGDDAEAPEWPPHTDEVPVRWRHRPTGRPDDLPEA